MYVSFVLHVYIYIENVCIYIVYMCIRVCVYIYIYIIYIYIYIFIYIYIYIVRQPGGQFTARLLGWKMTRKTENGHFIKPLH